MKGLLAFASVFILAIVGSSIEAIARGDCDESQLTQCGRELYYGVQEDETFYNNETYHQQRCNAQMDCAEKVLCFANRCLEQKGLDFITTAIRGVQYEVMHLCHPHADPEHKRRYKEMADCMNKIWPSIYSCDIKTREDVAAATTATGVSLSRFCCAISDAEECFGNAAKVKECNTWENEHWKNHIPTYSGGMYRFLCSNSTYYKNPKECKNVPQADGKGPTPPTFLEGILKIARLLPATIQ